MNLRLSSFLTPLGIGLFCAATALAQTESSDPRTGARQAYDAGTLAFEKEDYGTALSQFKKANELLASPHAQFWVARSLDKLDQTDEAIKAYEQLLDHPEAAKIGDEKVATARERLAALKGQGQPATSTVVGQPSPVAPPAFEAPPQREAKFTWKNHLFELGVITGPLFLNSKHNLAEPGAPSADYTLAWLLGARVGYYPVRFVGFELEGAHGWGRVKADAAPAQEEGAQFNIARGFVVGQYPVERFVPFAFVGGGVIHADSEILGQDLDFVLTGGVGAKVAVSKIFTPRLDFQLNMTQKRGGGFSEGIVVHPALLLGIDFTLGR